MAVQRYERDSTAAPEQVREALHAELREWRESVLPPALRNAGVLQVTGTVEGRTFVMRYDSTGIRGKPLDDVELRGLITDGAGGGTRVVAALHHDDGLRTLMAVAIVVIAVIGWFSLAGAFVGVVFAGFLVLDAWWRAQRASRLVPLQRLYLIERLEHALRSAEQANERREPPG